MELLKDWQGCKRPERKVFEGKYVRLEPLDLELHIDDLLEVSSGQGAEERMAHTFHYPATKEELRNWIIRELNSDEAIIFAVRDKSTGKVGGRQGFMAINEAHGVAEIGRLLWGPLISRRPAATEAFYLFAKHLFEELGYRRLAWKFHCENVASINAALRFGFTPEGTFRQHSVMKGANRDSCWFSIIDKEWPKLKDSFKKWLSPDNFDENGIQKCRLVDFRS